MTTTTSPLGLTREEIAKHAEHWDKDRPMTRLARQLLAEMDAHAATKAELREVRVEVERLGAAVEVADGVIAWAIDHGANVRPVLETVRKVIPGSAA